VLAFLPFAQSTFGVDFNEVSDTFGTSVSLADLNADGFADCIIGTPGEARSGLANVGQFAIVPGGPGGPGSGPPSTFWHQNSGGVLEVMEVGDRLGDMVAAGDFNGDAFFDAVVTASSEDLGGAADCGVIHVLYGSPAGITAAGDQLWHQNSGGVPDANELLDMIGVLAR
jgi:hypothetical protein